MVISNDGKSATTPALTLVPASDGLFALGRMDRMKGRNKNKILFCLNDGHSETDQINLH
ncbi:Uncharacterized protein dnm_052570 [Desulfonema magnum]|uniref:Uncharacterized protein n=1 Tax=Desulfonema magnum TaxID=45655 RepID=A0A975BPS6_9BACT|nr:Uncharacterized protein dnm_052570 [Desulfonema magnum]